MLSDAKRREIKLGFSVNDLVRYNNIMFETVVQGMIVALSLNPFDPDEKTSFEDCRDYGSPPDHEATG